MSQDNRLPDTLTPTTPLSSDNNDFLPPTWGRLVRRKVYILSIELRNHSYMFGRKETCDILVDTTKMTPNLLKLTSKEHFIITRDDTLMPYIKDISKNGTYLNGELIGKGKAVALRDGDLISVGHKIHEVYQYKDETTSSVSEDFDKKYKITRLIGKGAFGEVYLAIGKGTSSRFAAKQIQMSANDELKIENEIKILETLNHPCVIKMIEAISCRRGFVYLLLDYMEGGDLQSRVLKNGRLSEFYAKLYVYQIALAVEYLHSCRITHRDLKPANVLLATKQPKTLVKVTDFGLSKIVGKKSLMHTLCGTPLYVAPEILMGIADGKTPSYTPLVDVWSLGCIAYFAIWGTTPFQSNDEEYEDDEDCLRCLPHSLYERIKKGDFMIPSQELSEGAEATSVEAVNLVLQMLIPDPKKRFQVTEVLAHDWFMDQKMKKTVAKLVK